MEPMDPEVAIIVLNWNSWQDTLSCLGCLDELRYSNKTVLVVDNGSTDGSESRIRQAYPRTALLQTGSNLGYAGGNNVGLRQTLDGPAEFVWVLNNDVSAAPSALLELVACMSREPRLGVLASCAVTPSGEEEADVGFEAEGMLDSHSPSDWLAALYRGQISCGGCETPGQYHMATHLMGPSLFFRIDALRDSGLFDERYFHYYEEMDLVETLRRSGWSVGLACRSQVTHRRGSSLSRESPQASYYFCRNHYLYRAKWSGKHPWHILARDPIQQLRTLLSIRRLLAGEVRPVWAVWQGVIDALRQRTGSRNLGPKYRS